MSKATAKERVEAIYTCLLTNKKIKTISQLRKDLKVSSLVTKILKEMNVLLYNASGKVIWNPSIAYTLELEEVVYNRVLDYSRESHEKAKLKKAQEKAVQEAIQQDIEGLLAFHEAELGLTTEPIATSQELPALTSYKESIITSLENSILGLHNKVDMLLSKVASLQMESKNRPRVKLVATPSTNISTKHNFFGEDL